jgi:dolichol-phosphate mannosyltransferase
MPENLMPKGWTSIMITISLLSGLQLISVWLLSLYIARIYQETLSRPAYLVARDSLEKNDK